MKMILLLATLSVTAFAHSASNVDSEKFIRCSWKNIPNAQTWIDQQYYNRYDKFKHCGVSCYLTFKCRPGQVRLVGYFKELKDLLGPGNAEIADIKANSYGIKIAKKKYAVSNEDCARLCDERYHR